MSDLEKRLDTVLDAGPGEQAALADEVVARWDVARDQVLARLDVPALRRWVRAHLLTRLDRNSAEALAVRLLAYHEDFDSERRDRSTLNLVSALPDDQLTSNLSFLAGSNGSSAAWDRVAARGPAAVMHEAEQILASGDVRARETTLHLLVLDPYGPGYLPDDLQDALLLQVLDDPDPEIRGLAAEVIAAENPEQLLARWDDAPLDVGERVRMAFWHAALVHRSEDAIEAAGTLALDPEQPLEARRTALLALGESASTQTVAPVLEALLRGQDRTLAEDSAQLMWRHHRRPDVANAAAESQFETVRELANRLLHPEMGSPAAGGSRPGDPTRTAEIFEQLLPEDDPET